MGRTAILQCTEPQAAFLNLNCKFPLFVGGYGSGKTETLLISALRDASIAPDVLIALYSVTYDLLSLSLEPRLLELLDRVGIQYKHDKVKHRVTCTSHGFGSFILRSLDKPATIISYESYAAHVDELDTLPHKKAKEAWDKIIARNRQTPKGISNTVNRVSVYTTPEGYRFCHERWESKKSELYRYVQASTRSNVFMQGLEDYISSLEATYPPELVEAYIDGTFTNMTSGTVYKNYNRKIHKSIETIKPSDVLRIGMDFNITQMAATVWVTRKGGEQWHAVAELHHVHNTEAMLDLIEERWPQHRIIIYPDATGKKRNTATQKGASESDIALIKSREFEVRAKNSNPPIKDRVNAANAAFSHGRLYVNDVACPEVAKCLEQQTYKNGIPDKDSGLDHQNDASTYPVVYEMPIRKPAHYIEVHYAR